MTPRLRSRALPSGLCKTAAGQEWSWQSLQRKTARLAVLWLNKGKLISSPRPGSRAKSERETTLGLHLCMERPEEVCSAKFWMRCNNSRRAVRSPVSARPLLTFSLALYFYNFFGPVQRHSDRRERERQTLGANSGAGVREGEKFPPTSSK